MVYLSLSGCHNKIPQTEWLKGQTLTSQGSGGWESKARMLADSGPGGSPPPGLQASLCVPTQQRQREHPLWSLPLGRTLIPSWVPSLLTSSNPNYLQMPSHYGLPQEHSGKEPTCQCRRHGWGRSSGGGNGNPLQYSCLGKSHGQTSPAGYSPWGCRRSDTTENTHTHTPSHRGLEPQHVNSEETHSVHNTGEDPPLRG